MTLLLGGLAQFGMIFERQIGINNAVREAARRGATQATADQAHAASNASWTLTQLQSLLANSQDYDSTAAKNLQVCFQNSGTTDPAGNQQVVVTVSAGYEHPLFLPLINVIIDGLDGSTDNALYLSTSSTFRVEQSTSPTISAACASA
jgi:Flp pilus assembly protein TadG